MSIVHVKAHERRSPSKLNRKSKHPAVRALKPWQPGYKKPAQRRSTLFDGF